MGLIGKVLKWIDDGYDGIALSNHVIGILLVALGILALNVDNALVSLLAAAFAVIAVVIFGWRMVLSFIRDAG